MKKQELNSSKNDDTYLTIPSKTYQSTFIDPRTDYGFKKLFGDEDGEEDLVKMINAIMEQKFQSVEKVQFMNTEKLGNNKYQRKTLYDVYVRDEKNWYYNLKMQNQEIKNPLSREFGYICRGHSAMLMPGKQYKYDLNTVVGIFIANFIIIDDPASPCINLLEVTCEDNKLISIPEAKLISIELPKFTKSIGDLKGEKDAYLYLLNHLADMQDIPTEFNNEKYRPLFERARIANFNNDEMTVYDRFMKQEETRHLEMEMMSEKSIAKGMEKGMEKGKLEEATLVVKHLLKEGIFSTEKIATIVSLPVTQVEQIQSNYCPA